MDISYWAGTVTISKMKVTRARIVPMFIVEMMFLIVVIEQMGLCVVKLVYSGWPYYGKFVRDVKLQK